MYIHRVTDTYARNMKASYLYVHTYKYRVTLAMPTRHNLSSRNLTTCRQIDSLCSNVEWGFCTVVFETGYQH